MPNTPGMNSANGKKYALLDYDQVTGKGLKPFIDALSKAGLTVENVDASNRATTVNGIKVKTAVLRFQDQQEVKVSVNDTGDITGFKLNGKSIPVQHASALTDIASSLATVVKQNSRKFTDSLAKKAKKVIDTSNTGVAVKSNVLRLKEAKARRDQLNVNVSSLTASNAKAQQQSAGIKQRIAAQQTRLNTAQALTTQLQNQLKTLEDQNAA